MPGARPSSERRERALAHRFTREQETFREINSTRPFGLCFFLFQPPDKTSRNTELLPNTESRSCPPRVYHFKLKLQIMSKNVRRNLEPEIVCVILTHLKQERLGQIFNY